MPPLFRDRHDAGEKLAHAVLAAMKTLSLPDGSAPVIVYGLPRGGLGVAAPVAHHLQCPLDFIVAKKIAAPENPELAIGAVTAAGHVLWAAPSPALKEGATYALARQLAQEKAQTQQVELAPGRPAGVDPHGAIALIVDDGIATGMTMAVAVQALREQQPSQIWICAPVAPLSLMDLLQEWCDRVIVLATPEPFLSVSRFYGSFPQMETVEALTCLKLHNQHHQPHSTAEDHD